MAVAALITWLLTAAGGFYMLGTWISRGGTRAPRTTKFPPALIFGHFALAAIGLVIWIIYVISDNAALAWTAFIIMVPVAALGFTMFARWLPTYRAGTGTVAPAGGGPGTTAAAVQAPERHFPVAVVAAHGFF